MHCVADLAAPKLRIANLSRTVSRMIHLFCACAALLSILASLCPSSLRSFLADRLTLALSSFSSSFLTVTLSLSFLFSFLHLPPSLRDASDDSIGSSPEPDGEQQPEQAQVQKRKGGRKPVSLSPPPALPSRSHVANTAADRVS